MVREEEVHGDALKRGHTATLFWDLVDLDVTITTVSTASKSDQY